MLFLAIVGTLLAIGWEQLQANRKIKVVEHPIRDNDGKRHRVGYRNPSTTSYRCLRAWFIHDPDAEILLGAAIPSEPIVFDGRNWRRSKTSQHPYLFKDMENMELMAKENGNFDIAIVDPDRAGQIVRGFLRLEYDVNGAPTKQDFPPMDVEIQASPPRPRK